MVRLLLLLASLGACLDDRYRCASDAECDVEGGRCETDGFCTKFDPTCDTSRRYQHAGELGETCFDDRAVPANVCAGGQAPAKPEGCLASVCARLGTCCEIAWTDACAQLAQQECDVVCDTRIAITATKAMVTELWDVRWLGDAYEIVPVLDLSAPLQWVAPAPGATEPRLSGIAGSLLIVGDSSFEIDPARDYEVITTIPFDRDRRDTIVASSNLANADHVLEILKPETETSRSVMTSASIGLTWGDVDRDAFPDAIARSNGQYLYYASVDTADHVRTLEAQITSAVTGGATPGAPAIRQLDWLDLDADARLDLAVFGSEIRVHRNPNGLRDAPENVIDCDPPDIGRTCSADPEPNLEAAAFAGAALPDRDRASLVFGLFPSRKLFRASLDGDALAIEPLAFPGDDCACVPKCDAMTCPGPECTCTYNCDACPPIIALIVRDLDGDHALDVIAIDARLAIFNALASENYAFGAPVQIPTALPNNLAVITTSVTGAVR